jgi:hypothetical protein
MKTKDSKWKREMKEYFDRMTDKDFRDFLEKTGYDFYKNVKTSFLGLKNLTPEDDLASVFHCSHRPQTPVSFKRADVIWTSFISIKGQPYAETMERVLGHFDVAIQIVSRWKYDVQPGTDYCWSGQPERFHYKPAA